MFDFSPNYFVPNNNKAQQFIKKEELNAALKPKYKLVLHSTISPSCPYGSFEPFHSSFPKIQLTYGVILQLNCNGILHCMQELSSLLHLKNILITYILTNSFPNYTAVHKNCPGDTGGGGLITFIHHSIPFNSLFHDYINEQLSMSQSLSSHK